MTRNVYEESLKGLYHDTVMMAGMVENALTQTMKALAKDDRALAQVIMDEDVHINDMRDEIEGKCVALIATQQPLARDLRLVISIMNIITDLERMGDHASDICQMLLESEGGAWDYIKSLPEMTEHTMDMVKKAIDAYAYNDSDLAGEVRQMEETLDNEFEKLVDEIEAYMEQNPGHIRRCIKLIFVVKYLERIGDHATNLGESVIFTLTGRHENLN